MKRVLLLLVLAGCGDTTTTNLTVVLPPAGFPPPPVDAGGPDSGVGEDAGPPDASVDAGPVDAGYDAGAVDAGPDAGEVDAGPPDAGQDAGEVADAGADAGGVDAGAPDAGPPDAGIADAGQPDGGFDAGSVDWYPWGQFNGTLVLDNNAYNNRWSVPFTFRTTAHQGPPDAIQIHGFFDGWWTDPRNGRPFLLAGTVCADDIFIEDKPPRQIVDPGHYVISTPVTECTGACEVVITAGHVGPPSGGAYGFVFQGTYGASDGGCYGGGTWAVSGSAPY